MSTHNKGIPTARPTDPKPEKPIIEPGHSNFVLKYECPDCGRRVPERAKKCPCGTVNPDYAMSHWTMSRKTE